MNKVDVLFKIADEGKITIPLRDIDTQFEIEDILEEEGIEYYKTMTGRHSKTMLVINKKD